MTWWMYIVSWYLLWTVAAVPVVLRRWMAWPVCSRCGRGEGSDKHLEKCNRYYGYHKKFEFKPRGALFARTDRDARYVLGLSTLWPFLLTYAIVHYTTTREWRGTRTLVLASIRPSPVELERIIKEQAAEIERRTDELKPLRAKDDVVVARQQRPSWPASTVLGTSDSGFTWSGPESTKDVPTYD